MSRLGYRSAQVNASRKPMHCITNASRCLTSLSISDCEQCSLDARLRQEMVSASLNKDFGFSLRHVQRRLVGVVNEQLRARDERDDSLRECVRGVDWRVQLIDIGVEVDDGSPFDRK